MEGDKGKTFRNWVLLYNSEFLIWDIYYVQIIFRK